MEPILKWAGGKRTLIPELVLRFPPPSSNFRYHEAFFGGGAVFFEISPVKGTINDINKKLMNFYAVVRDHPQELINKAGEYKYEENEYYKLREIYNDNNLSNIESASILLYLNKTAYNGLYRENSSGAFNVPFGTYNNPTIVNERQILKASRLLKNVDIHSDDFSYVLNCAEKGDLCYFDPPYVPISTTSNFTTYSSNGFTNKNQESLCNLCNTLDEKGIFFILSNSYREELKGMYEKNPNFTIDIINASRMISCKTASRGIIKELLIHNIPKTLTRKYRLYGFY